MKATAYVVGPKDGPGAGLTDLVRRYDFATVLPYAGLMQAERQISKTPLCFFLFAAVDDVEDLRRIAEGIRFSSNRRLRFSPLIYFSESPSVETISRCINMGFDDVITMPFTRERVMDRINRQIGNTLTYYETTTYFGPSRRGRASALKPSEQARQGGQCRRMEIIRNPGTGVSVVRDDYLPAARASDTVLL